MTAGNLLPQWFALRTFSGLGRFRVAYIVPRKRSSSLRALLNASRGRFGRGFADSIALWLPLMRGTLHARQSSTKQAPPSGKHFGWNLIAPSCRTRAISAGLPPLQQSAHGGVA